VGGPFRSYAGYNVVAAIAIVATRALVVSQPLRHRWQFMYRTTV